jgi:hypothetical protein
VKQLYPIGLEHRTSDLNRKKGEYIVPSPGQLMGMTNSRNGAFKYMLALMHILEILSGSTLEYQIAQHN